MVSPKPFHIDVPQEKIDRLRQKLALADFPDELEESGWDLGSPLTDIKRLTKAWQEHDWRSAEKELNKYPHFHTDIHLDSFGTLDIHFVHAQSAGSNSIPLLFVHGCECTAFIALLCFCIHMKWFYNGHHPHIELL